MTSNGGAVGGGGTGGPVVGGTLVVATVVGETVDRAPAGGATVGSGGNVDVGVRAIVVDGRPVEVVDLAAESR